MSAPSRYSVWTIVAPVALIGLFALAVLLVAGVVTAPAPPTETVQAIEETPEEGGGPETVAVGPDVPASYKIRKGDTLSGIAERYGVTEDHIRALNPGLDPLALIPGTRIKLRDAA